MNPAAGFLGSSSAAVCSEASLVSTWTQTRGFSHATLDDGDDKPTVNRSPLLRPAPLRDVALIRRSFYAASVGLPATERAFVTAKLAELGGGD